MEEQTYQIFDGNDREFSTVLTSNANIRRVCEILTQCSFKSHAERVHYAELGDIPPEQEEDGTLVYDFTNVYTSKAIACAAIAEQLFFDAPPLLHRPTGSTPVPGPSELYDALIRSEVWRAFEDWLGKFGENPFEVTALLNTLAANPSLTTIIQRMSDLQTAGSTNTDTGETPSSGSADFSAKTDAGRN
jgi:hypothetical protein